MPRLIGASILLVAVGLLGAHSSSATLPSIRPVDGFVPNEETAIAIAKAVWMPIYGKRILNEGPFTARLRGGNWIVRGTVPPGTRGGTAVAQISRKTGCIHAVYHAK